MGDRATTATALSDKHSLQLFSFEPYDCQHDESSEQSVITKFLTKVKTAVAGPNSQTVDSGSSNAISSETDLDFLQPALDNADQKSSNSAQDLPLHSAQQTHLSPPPLPNSNNSEKSNGLHKKHATQLISTEPIDTLANELNEESESNRTSLEQVSPNHDFYDSDDAQSVMTTFSVSNYNSLNRIIGRLRGVQAVPQLNVEYWMPDSQVNECRDCNAPFKFYRRKHHCRVCGMSRMYTLCLQFHLLYTTQVKYFAQSALRILSTAKLLATLARCESASFAIPIYSPRRKRQWLDHSLIRNEVI